MIKTSRTKLEDTEYLASGSWKCDKSPAGAHFLIADKKKHKFVCKYCEKTKPLFEPVVIPKVETETVEEK